MTRDEHDLYELYRSYVRHEDSLINFRLTWYMVGQTATTTGLGYFLSKSDGLAQVSRLLDTWPAATLLFICAIGAVIAFVTLISVSSADRALASLKLSYEKTMLPLAGFPSITGGGNGWVAIFGSLMHFAIPILGLVFWGFIAFAVWANFDAINSKTRHDVDRLIALEEAQLSFRAPPAMPACPEPRVMQ